MNFKLMFISILLMIVCGIVSVVCLEFKQVIGVLTLIVIYDIFTELDLREGAPKS